MQLRSNNDFLRPEWLQRPYAFTVPAQVEENYFPNERFRDEDHNCFERTLTALCAAYGVDASVIRYAIHYDVEDSPRFELLKPMHPHSGDYSPLELLAIFRSLRFNESFTSMSFAQVSLDILNLMKDPYGLENICTTSKYGSPVNVSLEDQERSSLLVQEVRALAMGNKRLRRFDFSSCVSASGSSDVLSSSTIPVSCGLIEALYPLCRDQATNIDWLILNGCKLTSQDLASLISLVGERRSHLRAIEVSDCGLTNEQTTMFLEALCVQRSTLEALDISSNRFRLSPTTLPRQLHGFGFIRKLDLSNLKVDHSAEPLLPLPLLCSWRLEELCLRGIVLNNQSLGAINRYKRGRGLFTVYARIQLIEYH